MAASSSAVATSPQLSSSSNLRDRGRPLSGEIPRLATPPLPRRRSSVLSYASDTRHSVQSSAGDYILPGLGEESRNESSDESSHWHSSPLAFALLPAVGGLVFTNGSAFVTDILLLGLAAIFLNWSCRLPWQWYHSAQAVTRAPHDPSLLFDKTSPLSKKMVKVSESALQSDNDSDAPGDNDSAPATSQSQETAAAELRMHETLAFLSTFILPALAAYLLHLIRGQLSNKSTVLVSDYNLTIFLLAAEIRPFRQLIRLTTSRTLHLQRLASGLESSPAPQPGIASLEARLDLLEARLANPNPDAAQKEDISVLSVELRKRYEPRIEAIERAVRRYEKRVTTLSIATENRLQAAEARLHDALSLAAVAADASRRPSVIGAALSWIIGLVSEVLDGIWAVLVWPIKVAEDVLGAVVERTTGRKRKDKGKKPRQNVRRKDDGKL